MEVAHEDLVYWANQHGRGIKITGELRNKILIACKITGETPEEFVMKAIDNVINK